VRACGCVCVRCNVPCAFSLRVGQVRGWTAVDVDVVQIPVGQIQSAACHRIVSLTDALGTDRQTDTHGVLEQLSVLGRFSINEVQWSMLNKKNTGRLFYFSLCNTYCNDICPILTLNIHSNIQGVSFTFPCATLTVTMPAPLLLSTFTVTYRVSLLLSPVQHLL
jgi:hypothetical protein